MVGKNNVNGMARSNKSTDNVSGTNDPPVAPTSPSIENSLNTGMSLTTDNAAMPAQVNTPLSNNSTSNVKSVTAVTCVIAKRTK